MTSVTNVMKPTIYLTRPLPRLHLLANYLLSQPRLALTLAFSIVYLLTLAWHYPLSSHDPSSIFFSNAHGYDKRYSLVREAQSLSFINATHYLADSSSSPTTPPPASPSICLGIATVARPTTQYVTLTVGSVLEGLTTEERADIHFIFFIAHTDPSVHPVYQEPWTRLLPDTYLSYLGLPVSQLSNLRKWEEEHDYRSKGLFDYSYLLDSCYTKTSAPYIAILEGDVLAVRGWYARALAAAEHIDSLDPHDEDDPYLPPPSSDVGRANPDSIPTQDLPKASWLYLRLFHTETYLGWNKESWPTYLPLSALTFLLTSSTLLLLRAMLPTSARRSPFLSNPSLLLITLIFIPLSILLFFLLGRPTVLPLPRPPPAGVQRMDNYGCCSQALVFARRQVPFVRQRIAERRVDYVDMLMEVAAGAWGMQRWTVEPSLVQHVGGMSSKGDAVADERAGRIWAFGFERWPEGGAPEP
ncbi:MAG: hypothetical protein LQ340_007613 [Diploschistes diacapsis]|nr:MAG: hypothetical protein LQ340_007613 [Diploschistes diacapsis]